MRHFKKIYVLGAGAVGCYFGGMLARMKEDVTLIARPARAQAINEMGLEMDCRSFNECVKVKASSDLSLLADADLVLLTVKSPDTEKIIRDVASILPKHAVILSMQNGIANTDIASGLIPNSVYPAVVYVAADMINHQTMKHHGRGELVVGSLEKMTNHDQENLSAICALFESASVPCVITAQVKRDMWLKFLVNCSYNAISGIGQIAYGEMVRVPEIVRQIESITQEFLKIASLEGVEISESEGREANALIATTMTTQKSSTAQDLARGKKTEIDYLNGYIVKLANKHGVEVPFNQSVHALIKMLERAPHN
ncbi:ketopantoate reductase family protein [Polynucleobacter asymbioticus]|uniref:ketopantoate reductase family protein n=1 Tax=Polynucleobacter asymbioticus TaxID=576611 RepID=UPI0008FAE093|nr:2-dehydropantoate 2-reductase [Polynucleobacter asymbioticus]